MEQPRLCLVFPSASAEADILRRAFAALGFVCAEKAALAPMKLVYPEGAVQGFSEILQHMNARLRADEQQSDELLQFATQCVIGRGDDEARRGCINTAETILRDGRWFLGGDKPGVADFALLARIGQAAVTGDESAKVAALVSRLAGKFPVPSPGAALPKDQRSLISKLLGNAKLIRWVARAAARFAPATVTFRKNTFVFRWADVASVCDQDGAFRIAPINQSRIENVSGRFILGMDRSVELFQQRGHLYKALHAVDMSVVRATLEQHSEQLTTMAMAQFGAIDVVNSYARPVAGRVAVSLLGIAGPSESDLLRVARAVFHETFLNLGGDSAIREAGVAAGKELRAWIIAEIAARRGSGSGKRDVLGGLLLQVEAGDLTDDEAANIVSGLLVGAIDTTATCVANIMTELVSDPELCARVRADQHDSTRLWGWCQEILRRRPHNPLVVREAAAGASIAGRGVEQGSKVFAISLSAMQDARVFDNPSKLDPARPEKNYMHFGRGLHLCSGRDLNAIQIPFLVGRLLRCNPTRRGGLKFRGPFPDELVIGLEGAKT